MQIKECDRIHTTNTFKLNPRQNIYWQKKCNKWYVQTSLIVDIKLYFVVILLRIL